MTPSRSRIAGAMLLALAAALILAAPLATASTDQEIANQVGNPGPCTDFGASSITVFTYNGTLQRVYGGSVNSNIWLGTAPHHFVVKLGVTNGANETGFVQDRGFSGLTVPFAVARNGTILASLNPATVNVTDFGSGGWMVVASLNMTDVFIGGPVYQFANYFAAEPLCNFPLEPPLTNDSQMAGFIQRHGTLSGTGNDTGAVWWHSGVDVATRPPDAPTNLTAVPDVGAVNLSWNASANATGYHVYVNGTLVGTTNGTSARIENLTEGVAYTFNVTAFNSGGESTPASITVTTLSSCKTSLQIATSMLSDVALPLLIVVCGFLLLLVLVGLFFGVADWIRRIGT